MKKIWLVVFSGILISGLMWFLVSNQEKENTTPEDIQIVSQLTDEGEVDGKREFLFLLANKGNQIVALEFPTWLEYNVNLEFLGDLKDLREGATFDHLDLNSEKDEGRSIQLAPNEKVEYRLLISNIPKGPYRLSVNSALGLGDLEQIEFTIEN